MPASTLVRCGYRCQGLEDDAVEVTRFKNDGRVVRLISVISADAPFDPPEAWLGQRAQQNDCAVEFHAEIPFSFLALSRNS
jgi:hypothetical protein